jgi:hypothetical protein
MVLAAIPRGGGADRRAATVLEVGTAGHRRASCLRPLKLAESTHAAIEAAKVIGAYCGGVLDTDLTCRASRPWARCGDALVALDVMTRRGRRGVLGGHRRAA